jgi:hypothetical protein
VLLFFSQPPSAVEDSKRSPTRPNPELMRTILSLQLPIRED